MVLGKRKRGTVAGTRRGQNRPRKRLRVVRVGRRAPRGALLNVKRSFCMGFWQPSTVNVTDYWKYLQFTLGDLPSYAEFTGLFDQYRINGIRVTFMPRHNSYDGSNTTDTTLPGVTNQSGVNMHLIKDQRSTMNPQGTYTRATLNQFLENGAVKSYSGNRKVSVYWKPAISVPAATGSTFQYSPWLQTSVTNTAHYGLHAFAQDINMNGTFGQSWDIFVTYYMQFKGMK